MAPSSTLSVTPGRRVDLSPDQFTTPLKTQIHKEKTVERLTQYTHNLMVWGVVLAAALMECLWLEGGMAAWLQTWLQLPEGLLHAAEWLLLAVAAGAFAVLLCFLLAEVLGGNGKEVDGQQKEASSPQTPWPPSPSPATHSTSWLMKHAFGNVSSSSFSMNQSMPATSASPSSTASPSGLFSPLSSPPFSSSARSPASDLGSSARAPFRSRIPARAATKPLMSVHTKQQLQSLLGSQDSSLLASASHSSSSLLLPFEGLLSSPPPKAYQLSRQSEHNKDDPYELVRDGRGGVHLSPLAVASSAAEDSFRAELHSAAQQRKLSSQSASTASSGSSSALSDSASLRRRRSSFSRAGSPSAAEPADAKTETETGRMTESQLSKAEHNMRVWIANTILKPVDAAIKEINGKLETELSSVTSASSRHLRLGVSSLDELQAALSAHSELSSTSLPYLIRYLSVHANQAYLVSRIAVLAASPSLKDFAWASGGLQPPDEKSPAPSTSTASSIHCRLLGRPWGEHLPTDSELLLSLFSAYMDGRLSCTSLLYTHSVEQPFSARYVLRSPDKPTPSQQARGAFYIHLASWHPPQLELVWVESEGPSAGSLCRLPCRGPHALFRALVLLVLHARTHNGGLIDRRSIGAAGLNIECTLH